jgi:hypothetical protein
MIMDLNSPSNASLVLEKLKEEEAIQLYPKQKPLTEAEEYIRNMQELYESTQEGIEANNEYHHNIEVAKEATKAELLTAGLYNTFVEPVCESLLATSREKDVAYNIIRDMVQEEGTDNLLYKMRYTNQYLAEAAHRLDLMYDSYCEGVECKIKEGLSEKDVCDIEDKDIKKYIDDCKDNSNKDLTNIIFRRVEGAVSDFIDDKKKSQFRIKQIYDDAKKKIEDYNQASNAVSVVKQTDGETMDGMDPDAMAGDNLNAKLDNQQNQEIAGAGMTPAQEAMAYAKGQESDILDEHYNVFDAMVRVLVESTHRNDKIKSQYINESNKLNFNKIIGDVRGMYTVLEAFNTVCLIDANEDYVKNMIHEMYENAKSSI